MAIGIVPRFFFYVLLTCSAGRPHPANPRLFHFSVANPAPFISSSDLVLSSSQGPPSAQKPVTLSNSCGSALRNGLATTTRCVVVLAPLAPAQVRQQPKRIHRRQPGLLRHGLLALEDHFRDSHLPPREARHLRPGPPGPARRSSRLLRLSLRRLLRRLLRRRCRRRLPAGSGRLHPGGRRTRCPGRWFGRDRAGRALPGLARRSQPVRGVVLLGVGGPLRPTEALELRLGGFSELCRISPLRRHRPNPG